MKWSIILAIFCLSACQHDEFDSKYAANQYCNCIRRERLVGKDFFEARIKCDAEQIVENRFFRLNYLGLTNGKYMLLLPDRLKDSLARFNLDFYDNVGKYCCKEALIGCDKGDSLQIKVSNYFR